MPDGPFSEELRTTAARLVQRYPVARAALLPLLHLVQSEQGYVSDDGIALCAELVGITKAEVGAVATFYTMFKREPIDNWLLSICTNPTCNIAGAKDIYASYLDKLGGHRDEEHGIEVEHAECLGICDAAPVVQVNYEMYGPLTREQADELLDACIAGDPPPSNWSGEKPPTFKEVERDLSGANDGLDDVWIEAARQQVAHEVPPQYRTGETDIPVTHPGGDPLGHGGVVFRDRGGVAPGRDDVGLAAPEEVEEVADESPGVAGERAEAAAGAPGEQAPEPSERQPAQDTGAETPAESTTDAADPGDAGAATTPGGEDETRHAATPHAGGDEPGGDDAGLTGEPAARRDEGDDRG